MVGIFRYLVSPREVDEDRFIRDGNELGLATHRLRPRVLQLVGLHQLDHQHEQLQPGKPLANAGPANINKIHKGC